MPAQVAGSAKFCCYKCTYPITDADLQEKYAEINLYGPFCVDASSCADYAAKHAVPAPASSRRRARATVKTAVVTPVNTAVVTPSMTQAPQPVGVRAGWGANLMAAGSYTGSPRTY